MDNPEVKATTLPQHVSVQLPTDMALYPRKTEYSATLLQKPHQVSWFQVPVTLNIIIHHNHHNCYEFQSKEYTN
jgi:hypothetical protein